MSSLDAEQRLDDFRRFCGELVLEDRTRLELHEFQRRMLRDYFAGCTETLILISKKNGKTTLIAALALFHLLMTEDAEVVIAAASKDQATILYRQAVGFVQRSGLEHHFNVKGGTREIRSMHDAGRIRVMASDENTADGVIPTLAIVDELHRHKSADLYGVFRDGLGPRDGQIITISTAGDDEESPLGVMRTTALKLEGGFDEGKYKYRHTPDHHFVLHEWSLDLNDDRGDMELVKQVNPAPWQTPEKLLRRYNSPTMTEWGWARFACGVWYPWGEGSAIRPELWASRAGVKMVAGSNAMIGLDLGWKNPSDTTAVTPVAWEGEERRVIGDPVVLIPAGDGSLLDDRAIEAALLGFHGKLQEMATLAGQLEGPPHAVRQWREALSRVVPINVLGIVYDPESGGQQLAQTLDRKYRWNFVEFSQKPSPLAHADGAFMEALRRGVLHHSGDDLLRVHAMNAVEVPVAGGTAFYFGRAKDGPRRPTDALRAASMAHSVLVAGQGKAPPASRRRRDGFSFG